MTFLDEEGMEISQSCDSRLLVRLNSFQISLNGGEKYYKCFNINYLANDNLQEKPIIDENRNWHEIEKLMRKNRLSLREAMLFSEIQRTNRDEIPKANSYSFSYESLVNKFLCDKYSVLKEFVMTIEMNRKIRINKYLNLFFYLSLSQNVFLNLCTFVFFSWDVMEPITTCISYANIVIGLLYWSFTSCDYQMDEMIHWMQSKNILHKRVTNSSILENKELYDFYDKFKFPL